MSAMEVGALRSESDQATSTSSSPRRLCDVCADDREATHSCFQWQQRCCFPCLENHSSEHIVVSLTGEKDAGCGKGIPQSVGMCSRHPEQRILFHCDLCVQCRLTQHEGHSSDQLAQVCMELKEKLREKEGTLSQEVQKVNRVIKAFEERRYMFEEQRLTLESPLHARANMLLQWANRSLDDAISSIQHSSEQLTTPWQDQAEQLISKKRALQAQHDHILQVLTDGKKADAVSLVAQLSPDPMEDVKVGEMEKELTKDIPTLRVEHSTTAVNQRQLRSFIGVLEPVQLTSGPEDNPLPTEPSSVQGQTSGGVSVKGSDLRHSEDSPPSASRGVVKMRKKPPSDFFYCRSRYPCLSAMCPISRQRLWILYRRKDHTLYLELFDAEGQVLTTVQVPADCGGLCAVAEDVVVAWRVHDSTVLMITDDGSQSSHDLGIKTGYFISCAGSELHYLREAHEQRLYRVKFALAGNEQTDSDGSGLSTSDMTSAVTPPLTSPLTLSILEVVFDKTPASCPAAVSAGGRYFAFIYSNQAEVYTASESRAPVLVCSYNPGSLTDACFCLLDGKEVLVVALCNYHEVHVVDHTEGGRFVRILDPEPLDLYRPWRLATDYHQHVWIEAANHKSNINVESKLTATSPSPPSPGPSDVCVDGREATNLSLQCQHTWHCFPCCEGGVSCPSCHQCTAVSSTLEEEEGCRKETPLSEICTKHRRQPILRLRNWFRAKLRPQSKLTQREDRPSKVPENPGSKVKDTLQDRLATLAREMQQIDRLVDVFEDKCTNVQRQKQLMEQGFRARADTLHGWVKQSVDDATSSIQSSIRQVIKPWQEVGEELSKKKQALQAQRSHILQVLKDETESDVASLEDHLSPNPVEEVTVHTEMEKELTKAIPVLRVEHDTTALNQRQLRSFVGVLEPVQLTSGPEDTPLPTQPSSVQGQTSGGVSVKGSDLGQTTDSPPVASPSASSGKVSVTKKPPREFVYSKFDCSQVHAICPISQDRLWMMYRPFVKMPLCLKLFDARGQVLTSVQGRWYWGGLLAITDDVILVWQSYERTLQLVTPDGSVRSYDLGVAVDDFFSSPKNDIFYLTEPRKNSLLRVQFSLASAGKSDDVGSCCSLRRPCRSGLRHSVLGVVLDESPLSNPAAASIDGRYFASRNCERVEVYARTESRSATFVCCYQPNGWPKDVRFCRTNGQEMLLVADARDHKVHVVDHTEGGRFVRYLDTGPLKLHRPSCLFTDWDQRVWIACDGGNVVVVDL